MPSIEGLGVGRPKAGNKCFMPCDKTLRAPDQKNLRIGVLSIKVTIHKANELRVTIFTDDHAPAYVDVFGDELGIPRAYPAIG